MHRTLLATSTIAALAFGSAAAFAQGQTSGGSGSTGSSSASQAGSSSAAMPKAMTQAQVNQTMKDAGFTGVQIIDAAYLVQATTKDGNQILVLVNAPMIQKAAASGSGTGGAAASGSGAGGASGTSGTGGTAAPKQ